MPFPADNISRFPYGPGIRTAPGTGLTDAEVAARRAAYLDRLAAGLPLARAAVAAETARIIADMRERRARQVIEACRLVELDAAMRRTAAE